jgi:hypothetical protein
VWLLLQLAGNQRDTAGRFMGPQITGCCDSPGLAIMLCRRNDDSTGDDVVLCIRVGKVLYCSWFAAT